MDAGVAKGNAQQNPLEIIEIVAKEHFDFIVMDWKLPGLAGMALLNRFRAMETHRYTPIIVSSGFLEKTDLALLGENLLIGFLEKPVQRGTLIRRVGDLYEESLWMHDKKDLLTEIFTKIESSTVEGKLTVLETLLNSAPHPVPIGCAAAQILIGKQRYKEAEHLLIQLLKKVPDAIFPLHLLGKIKLLKKEYVDAQKILKKAYSRSPKNVERLNLLGNAALHNLEYEEADSFFNKALTIDKLNVTASSGVKVVKTIFDYINEANKKPGESLASLLNTIGISHIKNRKYEEGIEFYLATIPHLNDTKLESRIQFNIGLGYLRWNKPKEASTHIQQAMTLDPGFEKVKKLDVQVQAILHKNQPDFAPERIPTSKPTASKLAKVPAPAPASANKTASPDLADLPPEEVITDEDSQEPKG